MGLGSIGPTELLLIFLVVLLFFGARKLPELARGLGQGIREFKKATREIEDQPKISQLEEEKKKEKEQSN